jgi:hypothetical protein
VTFTGRGRGLRHLPPLDVTSIFVTPLGALSAPAATLTPSTPALHTRDAAGSNAAWTTRGRTGHCADPLMGSA